MDPDSIHKNDNYSYQDFKVRMIFKNACEQEKCHSNSEENHSYCDNCKTNLSKELGDWNMIKDII
jgi:hypothetical protein